MRLDEVTDTGGNAVALMTVSAYTSREHLTLIGNHYFPDNRETGFGQKYTRRELSTVNLSPVKICVHVGLKYSMI